MTTISRATAQKLLIAQSYAAEGADAADLRRQADTVTPGQIIRVGKDRIVVR